MKSLPSRIATLLDMTIKNLEKVLYFEQFIVVEPGLTDLKKGQIISEDQYIDYQDEFGEDSFSASIGAEAIEQLLQNINLLEDKDLRLLGGDDLINYMENGQNTDALPNHSYSGEPNEWAWYNSYTNPRRQVFLQLKVDF